MVATSIKFFVSATSISTKRVTTYVSTVRVRVTLISRDTNFTAYQWLNIECFGMILVHVVIKIKLKDLSGTRLLGR